MRFICLATGVALLLSLGSPSVEAAMLPVRPTCEYMTDPLGIDTPKPRLTWQLESDERGAAQVAYQILVASSDDNLAADKADVWDSGRVASDRSLFIEYAGPALQSNTRYAWKVRVWDKAGAVTENKPAFWRTGLMTYGEWHGDWIARNDDTKRQPAPLLRRSFDTRGPIKEANLFVCGLGYYELHLNGKKVGDHVLDPGYTTFNKRALYASYDVTQDLIAGGPNALGIVLGTGWFDVHSIAVWYFERAPWRSAPELLLELRITYADGSTEIVKSDDTWKTSTGPITYDSIYGGESYDARLEQKGWDSAGFDDAAWQPAQVVGGPGGAIVSQVMPPIKIIQTLAAKTITEPKPGVYVVDFGQNFAGVDELTLEAPAGTKITMRHAERLHPDGTVDQAESARHQRQKPQHFQVSEYTTAGRGKETWAPRFTYYGHQYVEITGLPAKPALGDVKGLVLHSAVESAGEFTSSNERLNKIQTATRWSYVNNLHSIPTDCPQREKNGWTGDAHLAAEQALFNYKPAAVYSKWIYDIADSMRPKGDLAGIAPTSGWGYDVLNGPAWDSALLLVPAYVHQYTGDERILTSHYDTFKRYVDYVTTRAPDGIADFGLNDWVPYDTVTPGDITSTAYYYRDALIVAQTADLLGKKDEAAQYRTLAKKIYDAFNQKFFDAKANSYGNGSQTSLSCALYQGLVPDERRAAVTQSLVAAVEKRDNHIDTGILGAKYVLLALLENGRPDVAYKIVNQKTLPGWGYWMEQGATTLWEDWKGAESLNHVMFGDVSAWFYKAIAGIQPDPAAPGWSHVIIKPYLPESMTFAAAQYDSIRGLIGSAWEIDAGVLTMEVTIPANTAATIYVPATDGGAVKESGKPTADAAGVKFVKSEKGYVVYEVGGGKYVFTVLR